MESPEEKSVKPELNLPITANEASQLLDGQEFTWQLEFENGKKVESVENRLVTFDTPLRHTGTNCTNQKYRLTLNFNYY